MSELKKALQEKIAKFEALKTHANYQSDLEQNTLIVLLREFRYLDSIAEYEEEIAK